MGGRRHKHDGCSWSISNENPISKRACGVYGGGREKRRKKRRKKANKKKDQKKSSGEDELWEKALQILRA